VPTIADAARLVTGGVDTHAEVHVAGLVDQAGRVLGTGEFAATTAGYRGALAWMRVMASWCGFPGEKLLVVA